MEKRFNISQEAKNIVSNYLESETASVDTLIVSLYAMQLGARKDVLDLLGKYNTGLSQVLSQEKIAKLQDEYKDVIKYCAEIKENKSGEDWFKPNGDVPNSVIELCTKLAAVKPGSDVLLARARWGQYAFLNTDCNYYGYEESPEAWAFSQIMFDAFGVHADMKNCKFDEFASDSQKQRYDYIFVCSPLNIGWKFEEEFVALFYDFLKEDGQMLSFMTGQFGSHWEWGEFRVMLVGLGCELKLIDIFNNKKHFSGTVLCCENKETRNITLVDAYYDNWNPGPTQTVADCIIDSILEDDERYVWHCKLSDLSIDCNLDASSYVKIQQLLAPQEGEKVMTLGELVDIVSCDESSNNGEEKQEHPFIGFKDLSANYRNCDIQIDKLKTSASGNLLSADALLYIFGNYDSRVARFHYYDKVVGLAAWITPFKLKANSQITEEFLLRALTLELTSIQAQLYRKGLVGELLKDEFLRIKIIVPPLERQNEICLNDFQVANQRLNEELLEKQKKSLEEQEDFRRDIHMKKHAIGQTIFNFENWWEILNNVRKENNGIVDDKAMFGRLNPKPIAEIYENLHSAMNQLKEQIGRLDRGNGMTAEKIHLSDFIEDYIKHHQSPLYSYDYEPRLHHHFRTFHQSCISDAEGNTVIQKFGDGVMFLWDNDGSYESAEFPLEALNIIFDNIMSNACVHGFEGRDAGNVIKIDLFSEGLNFVITIANNGKPINPQLSGKDVFTYGKTSQGGKNHFGIGGYEVYRLMREFGGDAEIILSAEDEFPVTYKLIFTKTNIIRAVVGDKVIRNEELGFYEMLGDLEPYETGHEYRSLTAEKLALIDEESENNEV